MLSFVKYVPQLSDEGAVLAPEELSYYKGIVVCDFADVTEHIQALRESEIEAIFFRLPEEHRDVFEQAASDMKDSVAGYENKEEQEVRLNASKSKGSNDVRAFDYQDKEFIAVPHLSESTANAFSLVSDYLSMAGLECQEFFAKQSPPNHRKLVCHEFMMHHDRSDIRFPANDIHTHVTVDGVPLAFEKDNFILPSLRRHVPEGYGVLFNAEWMHAVDRQVKRTGRTVFAGHKGHDFLSFDK